MLKSRVRPERLVSDASVTFLPRYPNTARRLFWSASQRLSAAFQGEIAASSITSPLGLTLFQQVLEWKQDFAARGRKKKKIPNNCCSVMMSPPGRQKRRYFEKFALTRERSATVELR